MKPDVSHLEDRIRSQTRPEPFSGVVYLTRGDEVLFEGAYGLAIRSESIPNMVNTRFQMASGSKVFTAVAVCQLIEHGELGFETLLGDCVDVEFPEHAPGVTIGHLLTHTSGITSYFEEDVRPDYEAVWRDFPMYMVRGPRDFLPLFRHKPMKFRPGERFDYNDGGFILLGLVVESVSGLRFTDYVRDKVLEPAGMGDSGYFPTDQLPGGTAYAYIMNADGTWRTNFFAVPVIGAPDGGAYTTAPDLAGFWRALRGHRLLGPEMTRTMLKPRTATSLKVPYDHYGYGVWIHAAEGGVNKVFVEGSDPGVAMRSSVYADEDLTLTAMGNTGNALWPLYGEIEKMLDL